MLDEELSRDDQIQSESSPETEAPGEGGGTAPQGRVLKEVPPQLLRPHPINVEIYGDEPVDDNLLESIKEGGIVEEIQVTPELVVISGHRRLACAIELQLETVPVCVRNDIETDEQIVWALLEANRTQRVKTTEQKVREIDIVKERLKKLRAEVAHYYDVRNFDEIAELEFIDPKVVRISNPEQLQEFIRENNTKKNTANNALLIALKHYEMDRTFYIKAKKAMNALDEFKKEGNDSAVKEIRHALRHYGFKRFDAVVDRLKGIRKVKKFDPPGSQMRKAIQLVESAVKFLPEDGEHLKRANMAIGMLKSVKDELSRMSMAREIEPSTERLKIDDDSTDSE